MNIAIVGATGLVGRTFLQVLEERGVEFDSLRLFASASSAGTVLRFGNTNIVVEELTEDSFSGIDVALFSAGGSISKRYAPIAAQHGCVVIDNSSAWRMDPSVPLVVPEVNGEELSRRPSIIANPNCSTIQLVVALKPLHDAFGLQRVVVSTYQSVSGAGQKGVDQLTAEIEGRSPQARISKHQLAYNTVFHGIEQQPDDAPFTEEERKMINETRRIMGLPNLKMAATCVRIPVLGGHSESVLAEFAKPLPPVSEIRGMLARAPGILVSDQLADEVYPTPVEVANSDAVVVGRLRRDPSGSNGLLLWVVADNLRKGAATNAVQILELLSAVTSASA